MPDIIAKRISIWCGSRLSMPEDERQVVEYGLEIWLDGLIKGALLLAAGCLFQRPWDFMAALFIFCSLRYFAGGAHCRTNAGCLALMFSMCLGSACAGAFLPAFPLPAFAAATAALFWIVFRYAPGNSRKNPITDVGILRRKRRGALLWLALECALILACGNVRWQWVLFIPVIIEVFSILPVWGREVRKEETTR